MTTWIIQTPGSQTMASYYDEALQEYDSGVFTYDCLLSTGHQTFWKLQNSN